MAVRIEALTGKPVAERVVEVVERKGTGHPDTICDALSEQLSVVLSKHYLEHFDLILHHNVDKALLSAGKSAPAFGGGRVLAPMEIYLAGRAATEMGGTAVPVEALAIEASRTWLAEHFHALDPERDVAIRCLVKPGSPELVELFMRQKESGICFANDTSCGVGFAPLSALERIVLKVERRLNAPDIRTRHPAIGPDIKVMGVREDDAISLTIACAMVDRFVADLDAYAAAKRAVADLARPVAEALADGPVDIRVNAADNPAEGSVYLTVTGTSGESGDDGQTGRGNRANGLITPGRPMTLEAVAGKNPVTHVGKLYNACAGRIAAALVAELPEAIEAECVLVSEIGRPIREPKIATVGLRTQDGALPWSLIAEAASIAERHIAEIDSLWRDFVAGRVPVA